MFKFTLRQQATYLFILLIPLFLYQLYLFIGHQQTITRQAIEQGYAQAEDAGHLIDEKLKKLEPLVNSLAKDLASGAIQPKDITSHLTTLLENAPDAFRMGVVFLPYAANPKLRLYGPYVKRENEALIAYQMEDTIDYTQKSWYQDGLDFEGWGQKPHMSETTHRLTVGYNMDFKLPGSTNPIDGTVRIDMDMEGIDKMMSDLGLGKAGYGFMLTKNGTYMSHPTAALVSEQRNILDIAEGLDLESRTRVSQMALNSESGHLNSMSTELNMPIVVIIKPIPSSKWVLGLSIILDDNLHNSIKIRRLIINFSCTLLALIALAAFIKLQAYTLKSRLIWYWTSSVSVLFAMGICLLWSMTLIYPDPPSDRALEMLGEQDLQQYTNKTKARASGIKEVNLLEIPTGIYLETIRFLDSNNITVTGYVWQKIKPQISIEENAGFIFADAEKSQVKEMFRRTLDEGELVFYSFEATIRQIAENTAKYPLDQDVLRFRLLPKVFGQQILLTPDLSSFPLLNPTTLPGVNKQLILPGWLHIRSYFGFLERNYHTNYGMSRVVNSAGLPELCFDFVIAREFIGPFIANVLPVIVVVCILFSLLLIGTRDKALQMINGFKTTDVLRGAATLLFPIMFAQISLRSKISASGIMYMEYFYFISYAVILLVIANVLVLTHSEDNVVHRNDNMISKILYWPMLMGAFFTVSLWLLY